MENMLPQISKIEKSSTAENVQKIALPFFIVIGIIHFGASLFAKSEGSQILWESLPKIATIITRVTDLPFLMATLTYGLATIKKSVNNLGLSSRLFDRLIVGIGIIIFSTATFVTLFYPDQPPS